MTAVIILGGIDLEEVIGLSHRVIARSWAIIHLSKSLAMEWSDRGIRVNSISPGYTATPMNLRPEVAEQVEKIRGRRSARPHGNRQ